MSSSRPHQRRPARPRLCGQPVGDHGRRPAPQRATRALGRLGLCRRLDRLDLGRDGIPARWIRQHVRLEHDDRQHRLDRRNRDRASPARVRRLAAASRRASGSAGAAAVEKEQPGWLRAIENISIVGAFMLGIYSATYPLVVAAAGEILRDDLSSERPGAARCASSSSSARRRSLPSRRSVRLCARDRSRSSRRMRAWFTASQRGCDHRHPPRVRPRADGARLPEPVEA